eukprot:scaffold54559_cov63-Phaeocystis_antarctica.AAC.1
MVKRGARAQRPPGRRQRQGHGQAAGDAARRGRMCRGCGRRRPEGSPGAAGRSSYGRRPVDSCTCIHVARASASFGRTIA